LKIFYIKHFDDPACEKFTEFRVDSHRTYGGAVNNSKNMTNIFSYGM